MIDIEFLNNTLNPANPSYDEELGLEFFVTAMKAQPEVAFAAYAKNFLRAHMITYLEEKFPRSDFESNAEQAQAVINEIKLVLLPATGNLQPIADICCVVCVRCNYVRRSL